MNTCFARSYDDKCGEYLAQYAKDFIEKYCTPKTKTKYVAIAEPNWTGGSFGQGTFQACCTAGVKYMFELALGINIYSLDFNSGCSYAIVNMANSSNWIEITSESDLQAGDIVINCHHTELYIGNGQRANFGNSPYSGAIRTGASLTSAGGEFTKAFRLNSSVDVDPSGVVPSSSDSSSLNYSDFFFNGIPDGKYSLSSGKIWETLINAIADILDFLIGIITYIVRVTIIGFVSLFDKLLNNMVTSVTTNTKTTLEESGLSSTSADDPESENRSVTIESILFNQLDLFDVNIFEQN
jgi:hypothetical protein